MKKNYETYNSITTLELPLVSSKKSKIITISILSMINGALYFAIATEGGGNIRALFRLSGHTANVVIFGASVGASLVYTMFTYKTLESLSLKINSVSKCILSLLAPFSAAAFLTAGKDGAELLHFGSTAALSIGISLFGLRMVNCIDASVKFPSRLIETKNAWVSAWRNQDYKEITRLIIIALVSTGYVASTTDAIYSASQIILDWFNVNQNIIQPISYTVSILGAIGTLPLIVYWSHIGLRQLTFGGKTTELGENSDLTDKYTYIGLLLVLPVMLGILGSATSSTGAVFGQLGTFSQVVRVTTSILYAACAGTPGMATLLRNVSEYLQSMICCNEKKPLLNNIEDETPLLNDIESNNRETSTTSSGWFRFFRREITNAPAQQRDRASYPCTIL